jgi:hypothetical protein
VSRSSFAKLAIRFAVLGVLMFVLMGMSNPTSVRAAVSSNNCFTDLQVCKASCKTLPAAQQDACLLDCQMLFADCVGGGD